MAFPFRLLCDLLNELDHNRAYKSTTTVQIQRLNARTVVAWFNMHDLIIPREGPGAVAFLSCLFPERRPDRVFNLQEKKLESIIQRAQCLGAGRLKDLQSWRTSDGTDFASCVERVMSATDSEPMPFPSITVEELDEILDRIAATSAFSSPDLRNRTEEKHVEPLRTNDTLLRVFRIVNSSEAKWVVRMLLKTYSPVHIPDKLALQQFHFLLPSLLDLQNSLGAAMKLLQGDPMSQMPARVAKEDMVRLRKIAIGGLVPQIGVMITRPAHEKARGIKHCCQLAGWRRMSVERKYDGEYCQVHIDLGKSRDCIKIFSKSGKDSTNDRIGLHGSLRSSLKLGAADCKIKRQCILEGELLVWNDRDEQIEPFHKIRKYVQRSGHYLGCGRDSPVNLDEHLMIMFYDLLLLDDTVCIREPHAKRRQRLQSLVHHTPGRVDIGSREIINFSSPSATKLLRQAFAQAIARRWEGFVLKGCADAYFSFNSADSFIKLKRDYIPGLGDTADFAIVGGHRNAKDEQEISIGKLWWTSFYIGCLENKDEVCRLNVKPRLRIIDVIDRHGISKENILYLNRHGYFERVPFASSIPEFDVGLDHKRQLQPAELFKHPFSVELMGAGFDKPADTSYFALRFPRLLKIHGDRSFNDTISFEELQEMAKRCNEVPEDSEREETCWLEKLGIPDYHDERSKSRSPSYDRTKAPWADRQIAQQQERGIRSTGKRIMASEAFPQDDSAMKRSRLE